MPPQTEKAPWETDAPIEVAPWDATGTPISDPTSIGVGKAAPTMFNNQFPYVHPLNALGSLTAPIENYTQEGRAEHPALSTIGDVTHGAKELGSIVGPEVMTLGLPETPISKSVAGIPQMGEGLVAGAQKFMSGDLLSPGMQHFAEEWIPEKAKGWIPKAIQKRLLPNADFGQVGSASQEAGYQPPVLKIPEPKNAKILRAEQVPGPDTAGKGNLLTPAAKRGEEGAGAELMGRGRKVLYTVPEYEGTAPKMKSIFREPRYAYRGTNPGESEVSGAKYDQLTTSPEEAASYARQKGGKLIRVDLNKLPEGSFDISGGIGMPNLIRTLKPIPKHMLEEIPLK